MTACSITVLRCAPGKRAAKRIIRNATGVETDGYHLGKRFAVEEHPVTSLFDLAAVLDDIASDHMRFVIRAEPKPGVDRTRCRRLLHADPETGGAATFRDVPRRWAILDFDSVPGPYRFDPRDSELAAIYCRSLLPEPWRYCAFWWGLSASAGFKPGVRLKLGFWLGRPVLGAELERHLKDCPIDPSTLRAVQPIYVARPILVGVRDPYEIRTGVEEDFRDEVVLPELAAEVLRPATQTHAPDGRRYVSGSSEDVAYQRLAALCRGIARAAVGDRHRCLIWAAARAVELDDAVPRAVIAAELIAAARRAGLDDHDADLARQVRNGFKLGIFGAEAA